MKNLSIFAALLFTASSALAADSTPTSSPAYVDFSALAADYGEPRVMIDLSSALLTLASAIKHDNPASQEVLKNLDSVRVHVYDTAGDTRPASARMEKVNTLLKSQAWEQIVRVREPDQQVDIYLQYDDERIHGLTVMAVDEEEAVFINVLGDIDPANLNTVVHQIDMNFDVDVDMDMGSL